MSQSCLQQFVKPPHPTIREFGGEQCVIDGQFCGLVPLDTTGRDDYTALRIREQKILVGEGFLLVYSITSRSSFERVGSFHAQIVRIKDSSPVPIMLVGNKSDCVTEREVSTQEGLACAKELGCEFVETSARDCINVEKAFFDVVRMIRRQDQGQLL